MISELDLANILFAPNYLITLKCSYKIHNLLKTKQYKACEKTIQEKPKPELSTLKFYIDSTPFLFISIAPFHVLPD